MYKSMYDILNKSIDYNYEYQKLWTMAFEKTYYSYNTRHYTLETIFDKFIAHWDYKGTICSTNELVTNLQLERFPTTSIEEALLKLCDFIINAREFILFQEYKINDEADAVEEHNRLFGSSKLIPVPKRLHINDKLMIDLVNELLNSLNYEVIKKDNYQCFIVKKNVDAEEAAKIIEDSDLSSTILQYNDYSIVNNVKAKQNILKNLSDYFEGHKKEITSFNSTLANNISFAINNFNIRHNNVKGKNANDFIKTIKDTDLIILYDKTYFLMLIAFRLLALKEFEQEIENIKKNNFDK